MESTTSNSTRLTAFSDELPLKEPLVIAHLIAVILTFFTCYPALFLSQFQPQSGQPVSNDPRTKRQKAYHRYISISTHFLSLGTFVSGLYIAAKHLLPQYNHTASCSTIIFYLTTFLCLFLFVSLQLSMTYYYHHTKSDTSTASYSDLYSSEVNNSNNALSNRTGDAAAYSRNRRHLFDSSLFKNCSNFMTRNERLLTKINSWIGRFIPIVSLNYIAVLVYTLSNSDIVDETSDISSIYIMPVLIGCGFLIYGTAILLHLLSIIQLPRPSTPEYYEGLLLTIWGFATLCIISTGTTIPHLGSEWRAINLGLLWFTGGLFSIILSLQTWMPVLRERNILNAVVICLTGRAIAVTRSEDSYIDQYQAMLGYLLITAALSRIIQIVFRKSPVENIPHQLLFQQNFFDNEDEDNIIDDEEEDLVCNATTNAQEKTLETEKKKNKCKHKMVCASITVVSGFLASILSISSGILWMGFSKGWVQHVRYYISDCSTYINIMLAISFIWCVYIVGLCTLYKYVMKQSVLSENEYLELPPTTMKERTGSEYLPQTQANLSTSIATLSSYRPIDQSNSDERRKSYWSMTRHASSGGPVISGSADRHISASPISLTMAQLASESSNTVPKSMKRPKVDAIVTSVGKSGSIVFPPTSSNVSEANASPIRTMRPSEYRAKRRSLLMQSPNVNSPISANISPTKRFSGVGGVLPDEAFVFDHDSEKHYRHHTTTHNTINMSTSPTSIASINRYSSGSNNTLVEGSISSPILHSNNNTIPGVDYFRRNSATSPTEPSSSSTSVKRISTGILYNRGQQTHQRWSHSPPSANSSQGLTSPTTPPTTTITTDISFR